jgi:peptidoglycan-associated lipoprotein
VKLIFAAALCTLSTLACSTAKVAVTEPAAPTSDGFARFVARSRAMAEMQRNFQRVRFEYDSSLISEDTRDSLAANVEIMRQFGELGLEIEGHCDERGGVEYNLALGDRRAESIRKYMTTAGIAPYRVRTISYGEERPLTSGGDASSLEVNRRAEFRITINPRGVAVGTVDGVAMTGGEQETIAPR